MRTEQPHTAPGGKGGTVHSRRHLAAACIPNSRRHLAAAYFPDSDPDAAVRRLGHWIKRCRPLYSRLTESGTPFDRRRLLTVREVRLIKKYLGEPGEET